MKQFIATLIFFASIGCAEHPIDEIHQPIETVEQIDDGTSYSEGIIEFKYNGHEYIKFANVRQTGVVHDPDCPCYDSKKN